MTESPSTPSLATLGVHAGRDDLTSLGVQGVNSVRQGKVFDIELAGADKARAEAALKTACEKLLANTVIENYRIEFVG